MTTAVVLPVVLFVALSATARVHCLRPEVHRRFALGASGVLLASIKTSAHAATTVETTLETIFRLDQRIVVDPTDLIGLVGRHREHRYR